MDKLPTIGCSHTEGGDIDSIQQAIETSFAAVNSAYAANHGIIIYPLYEEKNRYSLLVKDGRSVSLIYTPQGLEINFKARSSLAADSCADSDLSENKLREKLAADVQYQPFLEVVHDPEKYNPFARSPYHKGKFKWSENVSKFTVDFYQGKDRTPTYDCDRNEICYTMVKPILRIIATKEAAQKIDWENSRDIKSRRCKELLAIQDLHGAWSECPYVVRPSDVKLKATYIPEPFYPDAAKKAGIEGIALVRLLVDTNGFVIKTELEKSTGNRILDKEALDAVRARRFTRPEYRGIPVRFSGATSIKFELD